MTKIPFFLAPTFSTAALLGAFLLFGSFAGCTADELPPPPVLDSCRVTYMQLRPLLQRACTPCHSPGNPPDVLNYGTLKTQYLDNGEFHQRVIELQDMPQGTSFSTPELDSIRCWHNAGYPEN